MGKRYIRTIGGRQQADWSKEIIDLIIKYPNVYADISFTAGDPSFYDELMAIIEGLTHPLREKLTQRLLFGSDFMVNLFKVRSYRDYLEYFSLSGLSDSLKFRLSTENPRRFLFGE